MLSICTLAFIVLLLTSTFEINKNPSINIGEKMFIKYPYECEGTIKDFYNLRVIKRNGDTLINEERLTASYKDKNDDIKNVTLKNEMLEPVKEKELDLYDYY